MNNDQLEHWLQNIYGTQEDEISCSECFDQVSHFVEVELYGEDAAGKMPQLKQHLNQCAACRQEYETLREIAQLEKEDRLPSSKDLQDLIP